MANNRLWMTCTKCDEHVLIAKAFGEWGARVDADKLDAFLRDHSWCGDRQWGGVLSGQFGLVTEDELVERAQQANTQAARFERMAYVEDRRG